MTCIGVLNIFEEIGINPDILQKYRRHHTSGKVVSLGFYNFPKATFLRKVDKQVESGTTTVEESNFLGRRSSTTKKFLHTVTEYYWKIVDQWKLFLSVGADSGDEQTVVFLKLIASIESAAPFFISTQRSVWLKGRQPQNCV